MEHVLLLNFDYKPLKIISWQKAIELWYLEKIEIIKEYENQIIKSVNIAINCPAVIRLKKYIIQFKQSKLVKFSRINVYARDDFTCSYCNKQFTIKKLTLDHVIPKSRCLNKDQATTWTNITTSCLNCNYIKGDRTPEEARMKLRLTPTEPNIFTANIFSVKNHKVPPEWKDFLNEEIEN